MSEGLQHRTTRHTAVTTSIFIAGHSSHTESTTESNVPPAKTSDKTTNNLSICRSRENRARAAAVLLRDVCFRCQRSWRPSRFVSADVRETRLQEALLDSVAGESTN